MDGICQFFSKGGLALRLSKSCRQLLNVLGDHALFFSRQLGPWVDHLDPKPGHPHVSSPGQACWIQVRQETETRETRERGAEKRGPWTGRHFHIQDGLEMFAPALMRRTQQKTTIHLFLAPMPPCRQNTWFLCVSTNHHRQSEVLGWFASLSVGSLSCFPTVETLWFFFT